MESTPEMVRTLAVTYAEQAIEKAEGRQQRISRQAITTNKRLGSRWAPR